MAANPCTPQPTETPFRVDAEIMPNGRAFITSPAVPGLRVEVAKLPDEPDVRNWRAAISEFNRQAAELTGRRSGLDA